MGEVFRRKRIKCLSKEVLPITAVSNSLGNTLTKNKYFSTCLLAHLAMLFMQTVSLLALVLQLQEEKGKTGKPNSNRSNIGRITLGQEQSYF